MYIFRNERLRFSDLFQSRIEKATTPDKAIKIVPEKECIQGRQALINHFRETFPDPTKVSIVPILRSGIRLGQEIAESVGVDVNPMQMSHTKGGEFLPEPICISKPDIRKIVTPEGKTLPVVFTETVVDTQKTILKSMEIINKMIVDFSGVLGYKLDPPVYFTYAYASKTGENEVLVPNLVYAFKTHPKIWLGGLNCDLPDDSTRELNHFVGMMPIGMNPSEAAKPPYYEKNFNKNLKIRT